jgi:hypothetical protein
MDGRGIKWSIHKQDAPKFDMFQGKMLEQKEDRHIKANDYLFELNPHLERRILAVEGGGFQ